MSCIAVNSFAVLEEKSEKDQIKQEQCEARMLKKAKKAAEATKATKRAASWAARATDQTGSANPQRAETRRDPSDGKLYTRASFLREYKADGVRLWQLAGAAARHREHEAHRRGEARRGRRSSFVSAGSADSGAASAVSEPV